MRITVLSGGVGGARFVRGLLHHRDRTDELAGSEITVIGNTGDDITLYGLRVCPDLDTLLYTLGEGADEERGWGRAQESHTVQAELTAYGVQPQWFTLGDKDIGTHLARTTWLGQGASLSQATDRLAQRWGLPAKGVRLLPMSDVPVETHAVLDGEEAQEAVHFQQWWVQMGARPTPARFVVAGMDRATPAPGVLEAIRGADVIVLPPSNPVVSLGIILSVPGLRDAVRGCAAPVVGVSPLVGGRPVRGHADVCLEAIGVEVSSAGIAGLYRDLLDGWLVDPQDPRPSAPGSRWTTRAHSSPLLMSDLEASADIAAETLRLAQDVRR